MNNNKMSKSDVFDLFDECNAYYPFAKVEITEKVINNWYDILKDYEKTHIAINLKEHASKEKWYPSIPDLTKQLPKLSYYESLKRDTDLLLKSYNYTEKKGEPAPGYIKDYMNKRRAELKVKNKIEKGE